MASQITFRPIDYPECSNILGYSFPNVESQEELLRDPEEILLPNGETFLAILRDAEAILRRKATFGRRKTTFGAGSRPE